MSLSAYNLDLRCSCFSYIEVIVYVGLLFFAIPINLPKPSEVDEFQAYMEKFNKTYTNVDTYNRKLEAFRVSYNYVLTTMEKCYLIHGAIIYYLYSFFYFERYFKVPHKDHNTVNDI